MTSPDWEELSVKYSFPYIERNTKDYSVYFKAGEQELHNQMFNMQLEYFRKRGYHDKDKHRTPKKDIHALGIVKHSDKMLPFIQARLMKEGKVIKYQRQGKEVVRNNVKWSDTEISQIRNLVKSKADIRNVAGMLGRSRTSVYNKWRADEIKRGIWVFRKKE